MSNRPTAKQSPSQRVQQAQRQSQGSNRVWWILGAVLIVVAVAFVAAIAAGGGGNSDAEGGVASPSGGTVVPNGDASFGNVEARGTALAQFAGGGTDAAVGTPVPSLNGTTFDQSRVDIPASGKPKIVMFVAHWCPHCQAEVPRIQEWLDANGMPGDVDLYTVSSGTSESQPNYPPGDWLRGEGWSVPTMLDDKEGRAALAYGLSSYPYFVVVDADGNVVTRTSGELSTEAWEALLESARSGQTGGTTGTTGAASEAG
ncbi:MAG: TlpA family protein disulfide reductase [Acidimicrobiales bacterium]|jgi:thiol-disulfide isomerase/thioredoxin|nr:TlpA family protein disulfide reductase [Acidimicrobiales bacterium]